MRQRIGAMQSSGHIPAQKAVGRLDSLQLKRACLASGGRCWMGCADRGLDFDLRMAVQQELIESHPQLAVDGGAEEMQEMHKANLRQCQ